MMSAMRDVAAAPRLTRLFISPSSGLMHAGECRGFISGASICFATAKVFADEGFHDSMISNNPLAVELETENDAAWEFFYPTFSSLPSV